ncbi:MAG: protein phosphatase 2C domain-containing protein [Pseudomonadota bacterium]
MRRSSRARFDVATGVDRGTRKQQEDAIVADFPIGENCGIAVLADGMGGHASGDVASAITVTEVFAQLKFRFNSLANHEREIPDFLRKAIDAANRSLRQHLTQNPNSRGMGSTLVATVFVGGDLYWGSVGDSPLYLYRDRQIRRLNEDHSMAATIDAMVASGQLTAEVGKTHPERNSLTSAIFGTDVARVDCPAQPFRVQPGDVVLISSDGLQTLPDSEIERVIQRNRKKPSAEIADALLASVRDAGASDQDNTSVTVIRLLNDKPIAISAPSQATAAAAPATRLVEATEVFDAIELGEPVDLTSKRQASGR